MSQVTEYTRELIYARVRRDLAPSRAVVHGKIGGSVAVGGVLSLFLCGQLGFGFSPLAMAVHKAMMDAAGPFGCTALCGVLFAVVPVTTLWLVSSRIQFAVLLRREWRVAAAWMVAFGMGLVLVNDRIDQGWILLLWAVAAVSSFAAMAHLLHRVLGALPLHSLGSLGILLLGVWSSGALAHGKAHVQAPVVNAVHHGDQKRDPIVTVGLSYLTRIKTILMRTCGDCHSSSTSLPWYYPIPGVKQMIDQDIVEAKTHLDISGDFPFKGHGSLVDDLEAIRRSLVEESMPPWDYLLMHRDAKLTPEEAKTVLSWVDESLSVLKVEGAVGYEGDAHDVE